MAFETGTATDLEDLLAKLSTFIQANGWTEDELDTVGGDFAFSKGGIFVSGRWDTASPSLFSLYQATAFDGTGTLPGDHTGDSGNGYNTDGSHLITNLDNERHVDLESNGPYPGYWFFENDSSPAYVHVVVEVATGSYVHFGFGEISKNGQWTGGEYCYGFFHASTSTLFTASSTFVLDGFMNSSSGTDELRSATMRASGLPSEPASSVWAVVWGNAGQTLQGLDTAGNGRKFFSGGYRAGPIAESMGNFSGSAQTGLVPLYPIVIFYGHGNLGSTSEAGFGYQMGRMADVRGVGMRHFAGGQTIAIGTDTWYLFPAHRRDSGAASGTTGFSGIAYKRVDA